MSLAVPIRVDVEAEPPDRFSIVVELYTERHEVLRYEAEAPGFQVARRAGSEREERLAQAMTKAWAEYEKDRAPTDGEKR